MKQDLARASSLLTPIDSKYLTKDCELGRAFQVSSHYSPWFWVYERPQVDIEEEIPLPSRLLYFIWVLPRVNHTSKILSTPAK